MKQSRAATLLLLATVLLVDAPIQVWRLRSSGGLLAVSAAAAAESSDFWDEREDEQNVLLESKPEAAAAAAPPPAPIKRSWIPEIAAAVFLVGFVINYFLGKSENDKIVISWAEAFAKEGMLFDKNFSLVGAGERGEIIHKESPMAYKFYASGRRYCESLLANFSLKSRQDLFMATIDYLMARPERLDMEVHMHESSFPLIVFAIAPPKLARALQRENPDLEKYARKVEASREKAPMWPHDKLTILAEHSSAFYDLMTDQVIEHVFSPSAFPAVAKYFRYLHFTSEMPSGSHRCQLRFSFNLPAKDDMEAISKLMNLVTYFIDAVGTYKLSPDQKKRAEKARVELNKESMKKAIEERQVELQEKKWKQKQDEKERLKLLSPEAREKAERKLERQELKKRVKIKMMKA